MNTKPTLKFKAIDPSAILPKRASAGAACHDLHSLESGTVSRNNAVVFRTGLAVEIPPGWVMRIYSRSGHGFGLGVRLSNCTGVIDSDYRGEIKVKLIADEHHYLSVKPGDRIAQFELARVEDFDIVQVDDLTSTERGDGGFGSTGA